MSSRPSSGSGVVAVHWWWGSSRSVPAPSGRIGGAAEQRHDQTVGGVVEAHRDRAVPTPLPEGGDPVGGGHEVAPGGGYPASPALGSHHLNGSR